MQVERDQQQHDDSRRGEELQPVGQPGAEGELAHGGEQVRLARHADQQLVEDGREYGETDERITSKVPEVEAAMKKLKKTYEYKIYKGAPHAFFNDTNGERYKPEAAKEAWAQTLAFLKKNLK